MIRFRDATLTSGIDFKHQDGGSGEQYLPEHMGAGLCTLDIDRDGLLEVLLLNGAQLPGAQLTDPPSNALFHNLGHLRFRDATQRARVTDELYSLGCTAADYDGDGFTDFYVSNFGPNQLWHNNGDGTFTEVASLANVTDGERFGAGVTFFDADGDGDLDLFVGNYVAFDFDRHHLLAPRAYPYAPGPRDFPPLADSLYLNNGDGTFQDYTSQSNIARSAGPSMGVVSADFDLDGDVDVFVACDGAANLLYVNNGHAQFSEEGVLSGVAFDLRGVANGSMGVDAGDLDDDGHLDLFVTNYSFQLPELFRNTAIAGVFEDSARTLKVDAGLVPHVNWGVGLVDLDNDADTDIFVCNGHLLENAKEIEPQTEFGVRNMVMQNLGAGQLNAVGDQLGDALRPADSSRGAAFDDLDQDGDIDVVILNSDAKAQVLENLAPSQNHWLIVELRGDNANRDAVGAKVFVEAGGRRHYQEVLNGRGYQSHYGGRLHFGLGTSTQIDRIEIYWPGENSPRIIENVATDQTLQLSP